MVTMEYKGKLSIYFQEMYMYAYHLRYAFSYV